MERLQASAGIVALLGFAWALSEDRAAIRWRTVLAAVVLALLTAVAALKLPPGPILEVPPYGPTPLIWAARRGFETVNGGGAFIMTTAETLLADPSRR